MLAEDFGGHWGIDVCPAGDDDYKLRWWCADAEDSSKITLFN